MSDIFDQLLPETSRQISTPKKFTDLEVQIQPAKPVTLPDRTERQHRELQASVIHLRKRGLSYDEISEELGVPPEEAYFAAIAYFRRVAGEYEEIADILRVLEGERLDDFMNGLYEKAKDGDFEAIRTALKVMDRRAKLRGLDAPKRINKDVRRADIRIQVTEVRQALAKMGDDDFEGSYRAALEAAGCSRDEP